MLKPVQEGLIDIFNSSDNALVQGTLVKLDPANANKVIPAQAGDRVFGMVAQDVQAYDINNFKLDSVTHVAYIGQPVGVYFGQGQYYTDRTAVNVAFGNLLYPASNGMLSTVASGNAFAQAEGTATSGNSVLIRVLG